MLSGGLLVLLAGLWWVQIVNAKRFRAMVETQHYRTVRIPSARGEILDRNGLPLAENRPGYNINLYLEELSADFRAEYRRIRPRTVVTNDLPFWKEWLGFNPVKTQYVRVKGDSLEREARFRVVSSVAGRVAEVLRAPLALDPEQFHRHYATARLMPYSLAENLSPLHVARFEEQPTSSLGVDLEIQSRRHYPHSNVAAHVIGYVRPDDSSALGEAAYFSYRLPDYRGLIGIEGGLDKTLRGRAGVKSVQVNSLLYRQAETIWEPTIPGTNVVLTLDFEVQRAAEIALRKQIGFSGRGAVVVMDVRTGDILALASNPTYSPSQFAHGISRREYQQLQQLTAEKNRATAEHYQAGSVFKTIVALAALETPEAHFNPLANYRVEPNPNKPSAGIIYVGRQAFRDTVPPGDYNLRRAIVRSSNAYFIDAGLRPGVFEKIVELGARLHLGERFGAGILPLRQETGGNFPSAARARNWSAGEKANVCIGQGEMDVTPVQVAVMTAALANGGNVLMPRLVARFDPQDEARLAPTINFATAQVRDQLGVSKRSLDLLRDAMLAETESEEGTGRYVQGCGFRVCGKTGTAERNELRPDGQKKNTTWFASFAPYEAPRYAVVVMVEDGQSGGSTCVPIAKDVYLALSEFERRMANHPVARANR